MDKPTSRNSGMDFTKNQLGNFNFFERIQLQQVTQLDTTSMRHLKWSSGHPESASPKGRVRIPRSLMVNGNMDTTPHFIGWSMHQISEGQKHNLTSRDFNFNAKKDHHSHRIVPFQPFFFCWVVACSTCPVFSLDFWTAGHFNTSRCVLVLCLCVFVMLCLLYLIWLYLVRFPGVFEFPSVVPPCKPSTFCLPYIRVYPSDRWVTHQWSRRSDGRFGHLRHGSLGSIAWSMVVSGSPKRW